MKSLLRQGRTLKPPVNTDVFYIKTVLLKTDGWERLVLRVCFGTVSTREKAERLLR